MPKNLTKAQARQVQEIIDRARRDDGIPRTAQQSIPFQRMFPDGICRVSAQTVFIIIYAAGMDR